MWLRPQGYAEIVSPVADRVTFDKNLHCEEIRIGANGFDTMTCNHCNRLIHVKARNRPEDIGGLCKQCMRPICPFCLDLGCTPFEKKLERWEARGRALRSYGL